jgi:16S rRNA (cytidine1402-2'-O)-methyltransferase
MSSLILVNLPIGNPDDITLKNKRALEQAKQIVCEDTRSLIALMKHYGIDFQAKTLLSFHDQSGPGQVKKVDRLFQIGDVYYASEAGSPCISDPAYALIQHCLEKGIEIDSYSGISSVTMALELSGLPSQPFHFYGFLGRGKQDLASWAESVEQIYGTHMIFESPYRIEQTLEFLHQKLPEFRYSLCREMTKTYQSVYRWEGIDYAEAKKQMIFKGEMVLLVHNHKRQSWPVDKIRQQAKKVLEQNAKTKSVSKLLGLILDQDSAELFNQLNQNRR